MVCNSHFYLMKMQELLDDIFPSDKDDSSLKRIQILLLGMCLQLGFLLVALILAIEDIESIIETGPIGSILGIVVFVFAYLSKFPRGKKVGLSAPIFSVICFSLIYFLDWSPREAEIPITCLLYTSPSPRD